MKMRAGKIAFLTLFAAALFLGTGSCGGKKKETSAGKPAFQDRPVVFADYRLALAVSERVGIPPQDIMRSHLLGLEEFSAADRGITDLQGIQDFPALRRLDLSSNYIRDLTPLSGLTALEELDLSNNYIADLSPLAGLVNLKRLRLRNNQVEDLRPLASLTRLEELDLGANLVSELWGLDGLLNLRRLDLSDNRIADLAALVENAKAGGLGPGDLVILTGNPFSNLALVNHIPALKAAGVEVRK